MPQPPKQTPNANGLYPAEEKFLGCLKNGGPCRPGKYPSRIPPRPVIQVISDDLDVANVIRGDVISRFLAGKDAIQPPRGLVELSGYWIMGPVDLYFASISVGLIFHNCHFDSHVNLAFSEARSIALSGSRLCKGIVLHGAVIRGNLHMNRGDRETGGEAFISDMGVQLAGAHIYGDLTCSGGEFKSHNKIAIFADRAKIDGDIVANENFFADGDVRFVGARIEGAFNCVGGKIIARDEAALILVDARIHRSVMLDNSDFEHQASGEMKCAIIADGLHVGGSIFLRKSCIIGEVKFSLVKTYGDLDFSGSRFHGKTYALNAQGAKVGGNVFISDKMSSYGVVNISEANIQLSLNFSEANIRVDTGDASPCDVVAIVAEHVKVGNAMLWRQMSGNGAVDLTSSSVGTLSDDIDAWNDFALVLEDFSYDKLAGTDVTANSRRAWLSKQRQFSSKPYEQVATVLFRMGHPVDAWDILREKRRLEREHSENSWLQRVGGWMIDTLTDFVYRPLRTVKWTAGIVLAGAILFGVAGSQGKIVPHQPAILSSGEYQDALDAGMLPMEAALEEFPEYPEFNFLAFSLDVFIPLFSLHQESFWAPASGDNGDFWKSPFLLALSFVVLAIVMFLAWLFKGSALAVIGSGIVWGPVFVLLATVAAHFLFDAGSALWFVDWRWLTVWYWIEIMAGWLLSSLLLLSVTGLLRPRIGGGD